MHDFWEQNITTRIGDPAFSILCTTHDPIAYAANLTMPKLVISATGDEFFYLEEDGFWWGQLPGETHRLMVANAEHSFATGLSTLTPALDSFVASILDDNAGADGNGNGHGSGNVGQEQKREPTKSRAAPALLVSSPSRPTVTWHFEGYDNETIVVNSLEEPLTVELFHAHTTPGLSHGRRDFRMVVGDTKADPCHTVKIPGFGDGCLNPIVWQKDGLNATSTSGYEYRYTSDVPGIGWKAFFVQLTYPYPLAAAGSSSTVSSSSPIASASNQRKHIVTTQVSVVPVRFPFPDCVSGEGCKGEIV
jgi:PhoPQ-activated pathogenicity-related protein